MDADEFAFLVEMLDKAELLDCASCAEITLHTHEEVLSRLGKVTEVMMRCTRCKNCRSWLQVEEQLRI